MKNCRQCLGQFEITADDLVYYDRISPVFNGHKFPMPSPTLCFACRHQKRLSFRNEMRLYYRKCNATGKTIISHYSPDGKYQIYEQSYWWSDSWDPMQYGKDFDFNRPFFEQFAELQAVVPRMSLNNLSPDNSDFCNYAYANKNTYLAFTADNNSDSAYIRFSDKNYKVFDCDYTYNSTNCYESIDLENCNSCAFSRKCINSSGLKFCYDMISCHDCIASSNLRNKQYYIFNKPYSKAEYEKYLVDLKLNSFDELTKFKTEALNFLSTEGIYKNLDTINIENSSGDYLRNCKNAKHCYNSIGLEDCAYLINCIDAKNCYDWDFVALQGSINSHEMVSAGLNMSNCHFCANSWDGCDSIYYCELCTKSSDLFGCIGLRHKKYCILNKQYSPEEYQVMVAKIISHMMQTGEWGEFFPSYLSTFAYNESVANQFFPLSKEQILQAGLKWQDDIDQAKYTGPFYELPDDLLSTNLEVYKETLKCSVTGLPYKLIKGEIEICKTLNVALPRISFKERHLARMQLRNSWYLYQRTCSKCSVNIFSTYAPNRPEKVYCEACYLNATYN